MNKQEPKKKNLGSETLTPQGKTSEETGWVIEKGEVHHPKYLTITNRRFDWSHDHMEALRFARRDDAERLEKHFLLRITTAPHRVCEHGWELTSTRELQSTIAGENLIAAAIAHRACCGTEHDPAKGKLHGYCVVCGVLAPQTAVDLLRKLEVLNRLFGDREIAIRGQVMKVKDFIVAAADARREQGG